jgi:hypothetical protein
MAGTQPSLTTDPSGRGLEKNAPVIVAARGDGGRDFREQDELWADFCSKLG